ncbi:MAG: hypothetical protein JWO38_6370 [Gemmataceae bacterium]|nr:hypothetical protein [Gemmataceae bacterium]
MSVPHTAAIDRAIRALVPADPDGPPDSDLLRRFAVGRDEEAFAELVRRYGPLVFGVCRRVLEDRAAAEDAFQVTFLALARRAPAGSWRESIASWLYTVAHRAAIRLRAAARRHQILAPRTTPAGPPDPAEEVCLRDALAALDEELTRVPTRLREPVVLCCLQGHTRDEAARALGISTAALRRRLERGRAALAARLRRRGFGLPTVFGAVLWSDPAAAVPQRLLEAAARLPFTPALPPAVSALAAQLARGLAPWRAALAATILFAGLAVFSLAPATGDNPPTPGGSPDSGKAAPPVALVDRHGDPLPPGAVARLGTVRQRAPLAHVAVSADGKQIVTVDPALVVRRFDAATGTLQETRTLPATPTTGMELSPTGKRLATAHWGPGGRHGKYSIVVWNLDRAETIETLILHEALWVQGIAFSPDEQQVGLALETVTSDAEEVQLWDLRARKVRTLHRREGLIRERFADSAVRFSPDGKSVAAWLRDRRLRCWDLATDKPIWDASNGYSPIFFFSPNGRWVVTYDGERLDAATGKPTPWPHPLPDHQTRQGPLGFSPDGRVLAIRSRESGVMFWEPATGKVVHQIAHPDRRADSPVTTINHLPHDFAFTPDGTGFVWRAGPLQRWDTRTGKPVFADTRADGHAEAVVRVVFSPDGRRLASLAGLPESRVRVWDVSAARTLHEFPTNYSSHLAFAPGGHLFALAEGVGKAALDEWDAGTGRKARGYELADPKEFMRSTGSGEIHIAPDGATVTLLTMKNGQQNEECILTTWDVRTGATRRHERVGWGPEAVLTPDGTGVVAIDGSSRAVQLLTVDTGTPRVEFRFAPPWPVLTQGDLRHIFSKRIAVSPDGRFVAVTVTLPDPKTGRFDTADIFVGDAASGRQLAHLPRKGDVEFAFSPDSRLLVTAEGDGVRLWETATWKVAGTIPPPAGTSAEVRRPWTTALAISPHGQLIATGHPDGAILLWDATLGHARRPAGVDEAGRLWADLAADATAAYSAAWRLAGSPEAAVRLIRERLKPIEPVPADEIRRLIAKLGADEFEARETAERQLRIYGERATAALREGLKTELTSEQRRRMELLLVPPAAGPLAGGETLRGVRAVGMLERIGTPEARRVLDVIAGGAAGARLTREAKAALTWLGRR